MDVDPIVFRLTIFVLAIFVGYFVVWSVTPALHTPLMAVTNAISSVIVVGALIAVAVHMPDKIGFVGTIDPNVSAAPSGDAIQGVVDRLEAHMWASKGFGFLALILASVNIFGGFLVTARMLAMYKKKEK